MKKFMDKDFLLETKTAKTLFHKYAKEMPIFDYHCHVNVAEIKEDKAYKNITELWLSGDHYKWRAMRLFGIDEEFITGNKSDFEKFYAYASVIEVAIGNPLYHWTHLELQRFFNINEPLTRKSAKSIYEKANKILNNGLTTRQLIKVSNVTKICSTDDPIDDLENHKSLIKDGYEVSVMPTFRPDKAINIENADFVSYINKLAAFGTDITDVKSMLKALESRLDYFVLTGCKITDHSISYVPYVELSYDMVEEVFKKVYNDKNTAELTANEVEGYKTFVLSELMDMYAKRGMTVQLHMGATRNNNTNMFNKLGPDAGFDAIDDNQIAVKLSKFLDKCNQRQLPKTIIYTLNPKDNYVLGTMMGNFASSEVASKVQFGAAWWFNDNKDGMITQLTDFANLGVIAKFVGMLTDSRSFTSYVRHEYFRRILCNLFGNWVENGEIANNEEVLGAIVQDISYNNIIEYIKK